MNMSGEQVRAQYMHARIFMRRVRAGIDTHIDTPQQNMRTNLKTV